MAAIAQRPGRTDRLPPGTASKPGLWQKEINVRDFIQQNYEPYEGDELIPRRPPPSARKSSGIASTNCLWRSASKGVLDISQIPSSITAHAPGYIDRDERNHRRPPDGRAPEARHHAERRPSHGRHAL